MSVRSPGLLHDLLRQLGRGLILALAVGWPLAHGAALLAQDATREALQGSEWYEYGPDDYHKYAPEDIEPPAQREGCNQSRDQQMAPAPGGLGLSLFQGLLVLAIAVVLALVIALLLRVWRERNSGPADEADELARVEHGALPDWIAAHGGMEEPLTIARLRSLLDQALEQQDRLSAALLMFLLALALLEQAGWIQEKKENTAREYLNDARRSPLAAAKPELFEPLRHCLRCFEYARYGGLAPPDIDLRQLWSQLEPQLP